MGCRLPSLRTRLKPFFTTKGSGRGAGLGRAMVCDLVRRWGRSAEIASAIGEGTCVTLRLSACPD